MNTKLPMNRNIKPLFAAVTLGFLIIAESGFAQGTAFTYQGRLQSGANPANGNYDISFALYTNSSSGSAIAGPVTNSAVSVSNGVFTTTVDFGGVFTGASNWLQITVSPSGSNTFVTLLPRQQLTPAPYAIYAETASAAGLTGALSGNGGGLTNLTASQLITGTVADARLSTNVALLNNSETFTGGDLFSAGVAIGGNTTLQFGYGLAGQEPNAGKIGYETFTSDSLDIVGAGTNGTTRKIKFWNEGGANFNGAVGIGTASPLQLLQVGDATVVGGTSRGMIRLGSASGVGPARTWDIGVPMTGTNLTGDGYSFVINDEQLGTNTPQFMVQYGTGNVGIGTATPTAHLSVQTINGTVNIADDQFTPALVMTGGPVPGDLRVRNKIEMWPSTDLSAAGSLDVRGTNGIPNITLDGSSGEITSVAINLTSDRNAKEDFKPVNTRAVLEKVASLPISEWQYKQQSGTRHIGPMAQDFREAFTLGHDEKHISVVDEGGVALAAIQGLNEKLEEQVRDQDAELTRLKSENQALAGRLAAIERALSLENSPAPGSN